MQPAKTIIEPFKIKMVEPIPMLTVSERRKEIEAAHFNLFRLPAQTVTFDLLTDSGTSAMSAAQWAAMMEGDESYAGSESFQRFEKVISELTGHRHVIPTHQGRSAENLVMTAMVPRGSHVIGNTHFDTTRANIIAGGGVPTDLPHPSTKDTAKQEDFKGNMDLEALSTFLEKHAGETSLCIVTVTNNSVGGLPVSLANIRETRKILQTYSIPLFIDAARFAENAYFIKLREKEYANWTVANIAKEIFKLSDGVMMSSKKDAFANIGGFIALKNDEIADKIRRQMVLIEGFPTYGGLAGRDLDAIAVGLSEVLDEGYLSYRTRSVAYFGEGLEKAGFKIVKPYGGHAVYIDAAKTLPHLKVSDFPGQSLSVALYEAIGIRGVEVGSVMLGSSDEKTGKEIPAPQELVRLAMPRRVYTQSHIDYIIELAHQLSPQLGALPGYEFTYQAQLLRHFTARFRPKV